MRRLVATKTALVRHLAFSPDGRLLAASSGGANVRVWDVASGKPAARLKEAGNAYWSAFLPGGRLLVAAEGRSLRSLGLRDGTGREIDPEWSPLDASGVALAPDGTRVVRLSDAGTTVRVTYRDTADGRLLWQVGVESRHTRNAGVRFSPDGRTVVVVGTFGVVGLSADAGERAFHRPWEADNWAVSRCAVRPDGSALAVAVGNEIRVLSLPDCRELDRATDCGSLTIVEYTPDGRMLASASRFREQPVCFRDADTLRQLPSFDAEVGGVHSLAFSPDGMLAAAGGTEGRVALWDAE